MIPPWSAVMDASYPDDPKNDRLVERAEVERIVRSIGRLDPNGITSTAVGVTAWWQGEIRWARNRVTLASDRRDIRVTIARNIGGKIGRGTTNQTDDASLMGVLRMAERAAELGNIREYPSLPMLPAKLSMPDCQVWSDVTYNASAKLRAEMGKVLSADSEAQGLSSAGYIEMRGACRAILDPKSAEPATILYHQLSQSQCSTTVRHPRGLGSGWAGLSSYDWAAIDAPKLAKNALDKCMASLNPVAVEPGRYTVVLEPQAVSDLVTPLVIGPLQDRRSAEQVPQPQGPFGLEYDSSIGRSRSKLGLKVIDERITISHDPSDPLLGVVAEPGLRPVTWIEKGVLVALGHNRPSYALPSLNDNLGMDVREGYRMSGGDTSISEMIESTQRGLLVTRFSGITQLDLDSMLCWGFTRDGLWLIENGKISKAIKNFRFTESPMYVLNQVEQLGPPTPVFRPVEDPYHFGLQPTIVPPMKARDFSFTSMVDAV